MWQKCEPVVLNTAETIAITGVTNYLRISNGIPDEVFIKFNWAVGDTEVSATEFDVVLDDYNYVELKRESPTFPKFKNARVICATSGSLAIMGW